jgi:anti-sigma factor RsiW
MTEPVNEQLSACLDGELPAAELDLLLKRLQRNPELREALGRYTVIGETLRHSKPVVASRSFADKVMAAVGQEPGATRRAPRVSPTILRRLTPIAGFGVAATVAAIAIFSVQRAGVTPEVVATNGSAAAPAAAESAARAGPPTHGCARAARAAGARPAAAILRSRPRPPPPRPRPRAGGHRCGCAHPRRLAD